VLSGVSQESVLDLARLPLLDGGQSVLYADDLLLFRPIRIQEGYHHLQDDILTIEDWVNSNYLTLNPTKCKYMVVSRGGSRICRRGGLNKKGCARKARGIF